MNIADIIDQSQDGQNIRMLAHRFGLNEAQTRAAVNQLVPAVEAGLRRETTSADGLQGLLGALASGNHARYLDGDETDIVTDGNGILGHIFGSKDVSRGVAARAAETSGVGANILKQMLPIVAAMVMGALAKRVSGQSGGGGIGDILGQILGSGAAAQPSARSGGGIGDVLGQILGSGAAAQPAPRSGGGLGDILGQVLGGSSPGGGGGIGDILNSVFGSNAPAEVRGEATRRAGSALDSILGGGSQQASAADDLLGSLIRGLGK